VDQEALNRLGELGIDSPLGEQDLFVEIVRDETGGIVPAGREVMVAADEIEARVALRSITELFSGRKMPPSFRHGPTGEYVGFFAFIESTVLDYCEANGRIEYDEEILRLYALLRRRPDGTDDSPLFSYMQAAVRLYMSIHEVSRDEFDAVCRRLTQSARTFRMGPTSKNYCIEVGRSLRG
jgi:hypothetical protein